MSKIIRCGCSRVVDYIRCDGEDREIAGICKECLSHDGQYNLSSAWHNDPNVAKYFDDKKKSHKR